jgi:hypothetical protein
LPCFYFDVSIGDDFTRDDEGFEYEDLEMAEYAATRVATEISHHVLPKRRTPDVCVKVRDGGGFLLFSVEVLMRVRRTAHGLA